jgi:hypothetical protein
MGFHELGFKDDSSLPICYNSRVPRGSTMNFVVNLDDDWLQVPGYLPKDLLDAIKAHKGIPEPKTTLPDAGMLERLVALTPS